MFLSNRHLGAVGVGAVMVVLAAPLISTIIGTSPLDLLPRRNPLLFAVIIASTLMAIVVSHGDCARTGMTVGILLLIVASFLSRPLHLPGYPGIYIAGVVLGSLAIRHPIGVGLLGVLSFVGIVSFSPLKAGLAFLVSLVFGSLLGLGLEKLGHYLGLPVRQLRMGGAVWGSLIAFFTGYLLLILFFALCYTMARNFAPDSAFRSQTVCPSEMSFGFFLYFSTVTIATVGYGEVVPGHPLSRSLVVLEVLSGVLWLVVYFALLIQGLFKGDSS